MNFLEILGVVTGLLSVWFAVKQNYLTWAIGLINIIAFFFMFMKEAFYPDALLHFIYLILSIYGIFKWKLEDKLKVTSLGFYEFCLIAMAGGLLARFSGDWFAHNTNTVYPYADSVVMSLSLMACWLMSRKVIDCWPIYIVSDVIAIYLYISKGLYMTAGLYFIYIILCVKGWHEWYKSSKA